MAGPVLDAPGIPSLGGVLCTCLRMRARPVLGDVGSNIEGEVARPDEKSELKGLWSPVRTHRGGR